MSSKLFGSNGAVIFAATLLLSACAGQNKNVAPPATPEPVAVQEEDHSTDNSVVSDELAGFGSATQNGLMGYAGDRVFFAYDSAELTSAARASLDKQAKWLEHFSNVRVSVEGHCDERGTREYNLALGERRATAVKNYLVALGIPASRLSSISYGKERPAVVGTGEDYWGQNRRGVLVVQ